MTRPPESPPPALPPLDYDTAKALAADPDPAVRAGLAARADARPELLYYLADDDSPAVRRAVAANAATPLRASARLARDRDDDVRVLLAGKLARALPGLTAAEQAALRDVAQHALELLAADQVVRVRAAVASALKDVDCAPPGLVARLARDVAREVAEPILRTCATLSDEDLIAILKAQPQPWVAEAIARRQATGPGISDAVPVGEAPPGPAPEPTPLPDAPEPVAQPPALPGQVLAVRPAVPEALAGRLSEAVQDSLHQALAEQGEFDPETLEAIAGTARRRIDWAREYSRREPPEVRARRLHADGALDEAAVLDALAWGDRPFVEIALALRAGIAVEVVHRILETQRPKSVTALCWRAGLSMRAARVVQAKAARIPLRSVLNARHGTDYPLTEAEMRTLLALFDIPG
ncbi:DUF2336 domain-containing protein [Rhodocista pekingensis]|uniref:DUF2336 domain-containing protein n=1 Tax=Rhodocista pekingensis TaxID=201185 RepID=A0ABW2L1P2_9PROT